MALYLYDLTYTDVEYRYVGSFSSTSRPTSTRVTAILNEIAGKVNAATYAAIGSKVSSPTSSAYLDAYHSLRALIATGAAVQAMKEGDPANAANDAVVRLEEWFNAGLTKIEKAPAVFFGSLFGTGAASHSHVTDDAEDTDDGDYEAILTHDFST